MGIIVVEHIIKKLSDQQIFGILHALTYNIMSLQVIVVIILAYNVKYVWYVLLN